MKLEFSINNKNFYIKSEEAITIAINQNFGALIEEQVNFFNAKQANCQPFKVDGFIGDTDLGGSCNVNVINLNIHCNGTHTESKQHIDKNSMSINSVVYNSFLYAKLITIEPMKYTSNYNERYIPALTTRDNIITSEHLISLLTKQDFIDIDALIIRTLPNYPSKIHQKYNSESDYPFLTNDAIKLVNTSNIKHLLLDTPSLDRSYNSTMMSNHHHYWDGHEDKSVTELVYIDNNIQDDYYILNLQLPSFELDAAPSRPLLYKIYKNKRNYD